MILTGDNAEYEYQLYVQLERIECAGNFSAFIKAAWHVIEPEFPLIWNWHLDLLCEEVQKQIERIARREPREYHLLINIPPRSLKSWIFTRAANAWAWINYPWMRFLTTSYAEKLAIEHAVDTRTLIESDWYQERWADKYQIMSDQNEKSFYKTEQYGYRITGSVGGKAVGRGGHVVLIDDPTSPEEAEYDVARETAIRWYSRTMISRISNPSIGMFWLVMQRLHEEDLSGYVLRMEGARWKHICLPAEDGPQVRPIECRKKYVNGMLSPAQFSVDFLQGLKTVDPYMFAGQYLQLPSPPEGGMFKRQDWRFWKPAGMDLPSVIVQIGGDTHTCPVVDLPDQMDDTINSWDMGLKEHKDADFLAGTVWGSKNPNFYLLDTVHARMDPLKAANECKALKIRYPQTSAILIEDAAGGSSAIVDLKRTIPGIIGVSVQGVGSKRIRAIPMSRLCQSGNLYLPHPAIAPWVKDFIDEYAAFDRGSHDDWVDSGSQAINYLIGHRRVWGDWRGETINYKVNFDNLPASSVLIISQHVETDMNSAVVMCWWSKRTNKLWVFDEFVSDTPRAEIVVAGVLAALRRDSNGQINKMSDLGRFVWWGNSIMASKGQGSSVESYRKYKINVRIPTAYSEFDATLRAALLMARKCLPIHSRCAELSRQMIEWPIEKRRPAPGYGLCRALAQSVSVLWDTGVMRQQDKPLREYSVQKTKRYEEAERAEADGTLPRLIAGVRRVKNTGKEGYLI